MGAIAVGEVTGAASALEKKGFQVGNRWEGGAGLRHLARPQGHGSGRWEGSAGASAL